MHPISILILAGVVVLVAFPIRRHRGSEFGFERVVRCRAGHLYTSTVVPGASFKAVRLGNARFQWCPVGRRWTLTKVVDETSLTPVERDAARTVHDPPIP
jgi:hypothetical protein